MKYRVMSICIVLGVIFSSTALAATDLCNEYFEKKEYDKAAEECTRWINNSDGDRFHIALHYRIRGNAYTALGKTDQAIADYTRAVEHNPDYDLAYYNRGNAYGAKGNLEQAIADYSRAIALYPRDYAFYNRGTVYARTGQFDKALADFNRAIELNPVYYLAYSNRGYTYNATGNVDMAIADFSKAIELNPNYDLAFYNRGNAFSLKGNLEPAIADYSRSVELNPQNTYAFYNLALLYSQKNLVTESCQWLKRSDQNGFNQWDDIKKDRGFDNIRNAQCYKEIMAGK